MSTKDALMYGLPTYYDKSHVFDEFMRVNAKFIDQLNESDLDLLRQFFPQTATWGLKTWESLLKLPTIETDSIETRRAKVLAKLNEETQFTEYKIELIAKPFSTIASVTTHYNYFDVRLNYHHLSNTNLEDLIKTINQVKYSHVSFNIIIDQNCLLEARTSFTKVSIDYLECGVAMIGDEL